jgi:tellurium resistance protein TerD
VTINLQKGQTINLEKSQYDLSTVTIGLGWDVRQRKPGFLGGLLGGGGNDEEYDLDAIAFLLDGGDKVINLGDSRLVGGDVIFFNNLRHPSGQIWLTGDNRTGDGDGDDEQIVVRLESLPQPYQKILFVVSIYQGQQKGQHFGMIENAFIRAVDARGREMARFNMSGDATYSQMRSVVFAEVYKRDGGWKFRAIGTPYPTDSFAEILRSYVR